MCLLIFNVLMCLPYTSENYRWLDYLEKSYPIYWHESFGTRTPEVLYAGTFTCVISVWSVQFLHVVYMNIFDTSSTVALHSHCVVCVAYWHLCIGGFLLYIYDRLAFVCSYCYDTLQIEGIISVGLQRKKCMHWPFWMKPTVLSATSTLPLVFIPHIQYFQIYTHKHIW